MKDKIIDGLFAVIKFLLVVIGVAIGVAVVLAYHFGIPYLFYKFLNIADSSYATYLAIWFGTSYLLEVLHRSKLEKQLKQYKEIHNILKGRI